MNGPDELQPAADTDWRVAASRQREFRLYAFCELVSEPLIYAAVLFSPWAFGTTQPWSIWTMNVLGSILGILFLAKLVLRRFRGLPVPLWGAPAGCSGFHPARLRALLAVLTVLVLTYVLISAWNASSTYRPADLSFETFEYIRWLPHSFDGERTWSWFWRLLGLAGGFWAIEDWLRGQTPEESRRWAKGIPQPGPIPQRLNRLLWVLVVNGGLLAIEGIAQRLEGSGKLLFLVQPRVNPGAEAQFGPWAYRANAAQYFNLLWPVSLGFWWTLQRGLARSRWMHHLPLAFAILMAACPIISTSRGGALISVGLGVIVVVFLAVSGCLEHSSRTARPMVRVAGVWVFLAGFLWLGGMLGWKALKPRMEEFNQGLAGREEMFEAARPMARDYPVYGTGPGSFEYVFQLYRISTSTYWPAQLHNDWLETRITFGWVGLGLIIACLVTVLLRWFAPGGIYAGRRFTVLLWLALVGGLVHARYDFPFQIHSLIFLFLILCAVAFNLSRRPG